MRSGSTRCAASSLAEAETEVDVATFIQWVDANAYEEVELADFYDDRFRAEFKPAFDAWIVADPFTNPAAPPTPFAMDEYRLASAAEAEHLDVQAEVSSAIVRRDIQRAATMSCPSSCSRSPCSSWGMSTKLAGRNLCIA